MALKGVFLFMRVVNVASGLGLIGLSIFTIINIFNWLTFAVFLIPSPIFVGFFGFLLIAAEFRIKYVLKNLTFLQNFAGRGIFNIYLSSVSFWFLQNYSAAAWIVASLLFVTGIIYLVFHCGYAKETRAMYEEEREKRAESDARINDAVRQKLTH